MKKVITLIVLFIGINAIAQQRERRDIDPEEFATKNTERLTKSLDLSEDQQTKIYNLNLKNAEERKAAMEARKSGERTKPSEEEREAMKAQMDAKREEQKEEMKNILSDEQFQKWETIQEEMKDKRGGGRRGQK
ncbi:DUF4890 domain-containing protein [Cellulophaga baltica]|uniref:DUF4890 domain-containing protein n=1 Tax=Cellulophaga TaxID=104264 RepID=UPI001C06B454|nr:MULTISPECIES: DUF4890 domain-containing protein [Cellulophaga]MBU2995344.1 DUF4890 domain-containing protein [Cellulophaga baltica]MDO6766739.1 DUF4890 domain-containing protein [Cellulophaga sp. 1_MG-2023]